MQITIRDLLRMNPMRAIKEILLGRLKIPASGDWFTIKSVTGSRNQSTASLTLEVNNLEADPLISSQVPGELEYRFDRLDLAMLSKVAPLELPLNPMGKNLPLHKLFQQYYIKEGFRFIPSDFTEVELTESLTSLEAGDSSTRWFGKCNVKITMVDEEILEYVNSTKIPLPFDSTVVNLKTPLTQILNQENKTTLLSPIKESDYTLVESSLKRIGNDGELYNTEITLRFLMRYSGDLTVQYSRRSFPETFANPMRFINTGNLTNQDIVDGINQKKKCNITLDDLVPFNLPDNELWTTERFYIRFKETSQLFTGEIWLEHRHGDYIGEDLE